MNKPIKITKKIAELGKLEMERIVAIDALNAIKVLHSPTKEVVHKIINEAFKNMQAIPAKKCSHFKIR